MNGTSSDIGWNNDNKYLWQEKNVYFKYVIIFSRALKKNESERGRLGSLHVFKPTSCCWLLPCQSCCWEVHLLIGSPRSDLWSVEGFSRQKDAMQCLRCHHSQPPFRSKYLRSRTQWSNPESWEVQWLSSRFKTTQEQRLICLKQ